MRSVAISKIMVIVKIFIAGGEFNMFSKVLASAGNEVLKNKLIDILKDCDEKTLNEAIKKHMK